MKDTIIKYSIIFPHLYPWDKYLGRDGVIASKTEIDKILEEDDLNSLYKRRITGWEIERLIYMSAVGSNTQLEIKQKLEEAFVKLDLKLKKLPEDIISNEISRKDLNTEEKIILFNKFIKGTASKIELSKNSYFTQTWFTDLFSCYFCLNPDFEINGKRDLFKKVVETIKNIIYNDNFKIRKTDDMFAKNGFFNINIIYDYQKSMKKYFDDFKELTKNIEIGNSTIQQDIANEEIDIEATLLGMIDDADSHIPQNERKVEDIEKVEVEDTTVVKVKEKLEESVIEEERCNINQVKEDVSLALIKRLSEKVEDMGKELGYKMISEDEYNALKEKSLYISKTDEDSSILNLLKKLSSPSEGAVLSELYTTYRDLENTNLSNIKAALGDFFNYLMVFGIEANEENYKIGEEVEIDRSKLLKSYQLLRPLDGEENIIGVVKYPGWRFKNKQFATPVIQNKK